LRRQQIILFIILFAISVVPLLLYERTNLVLARDLSIILLYPFHATTDFVEYLAVSNVRTEKLEILVNQLKLENAALKDKLVVDTTELKSSAYDLIKASVVGRDPLNINGYLHINRGVSDGVIENQTVITVEGFVGKIRHTGPLTSIVETIENKGFTVSAIDINTGIHGIIKKQDNLMFRYVRHGDEVNVGDSIQTSGMSEIFPKGILIGTIHAISESEDMFFKNVYVTPAAQINRLASVYIIQNIRTPPVAD
jgi:rod shape-determining protein MreC